MEINIKHDISRLKKELSVFQKSKLPMVTARSLNKVADQAKTMAARKIADSEIAKLSSKTAKALITIGYATRIKLVSTLYIAGKRVPIIALKARQIAGGVTYSFNGKREFIPHAFIATMPNGHKGVFTRTKDVRGRGKIKTVKTGDNTGKKYKAGLHIAQASRPFLTQEYVDANINSEIQAFVRAKFPQIFKHEMEYEEAKSKAYGT